jgi:hypothetical protein
MLTPALAQSLGTEILALSLLDLERVRPLLEANLGRRGRPPRDQVAMLRSIVLMSLMGVAGFNAWASTLKQRPELGVLCGFKPGDVPGVGTFYDFMARLLDGPAPLNCPGWRRPSTRTRRGKKRFLVFALKESPRRPGRVSEEVQAATSRLEKPLGQRFVDRLNRILARCAVAPSASSGVLGPQLDVAGDSSMLVTQARSGGKAAPDTEAPAGWKASRCSDPDAAFGYNTTTAGLVFGHRLHVLATPTGDGDLPLAVDVGYAATPDAAQAPDALAGLVKVMEEEKIPCKIRSFIADAGYDATELYRFVMKLGARPVIALNPHNLPVVQEGQERDDAGRPLCVGGAPMKLHQRNLRGQASTWHCPAKYPTHLKGELVHLFDKERCPRGQACDQSSLGPWTTLRHDADPRMNPVVARGSAEEKALFDKRTSAERIFAYFKGKGHLSERPYRRRHVFHIMVLCHALSLHAKAWVRRGIGSKRKLSELDELRAALEQVFAAAA